LTLQILTAFTIDATINTSTTTINTRT